MIIARTYYCLCNDVFIIMNMCYGYKEVHFAIPVSGADQNHQVFYV